MSNNPSIQETLDFVRDAHQNHLIKPDRTNIPYHWHLLRVMLRLGPHATHEEKLVALLHDVLEDTTVTKENLKSRGYSDRVISDVVYCSYTEFPKLSKQHWMRMINQEAPSSVIRVKYADISDNLGFERMFGLYDILKNELMIYNQGESSRSKSFYRQTEGFPILARIFTQILGKTPYSTEPSVFPVYYDALNYLLNGSENREHEVSNILSLEFSDRLLIKDIFQYLPVEEQIQYMRLQNLTSWTIKGNLSIIKDNAENSYVALNVSPEYAKELQFYLSANGLDNYIQNQTNRDKNSFHVTLINAADFGYIQKNSPEKLEIINSNLHLDFDMFFHGIGKAEGFVRKNPEKQTAYFAVLENPLLDSFREQLSLKKHDFHLTLGFENKDVHGVAKNRSTIIASPVEIHELYYSHQAINTKKIKP